MNRKKIESIEINVPKDTEIKVKWLEEENKSFDPNGLPIDFTSKYHIEDEDSDEI